MSNAVFHFAFRYSPSIWTRSSIDEIKAFNPEDGFIETFLKGTVDKYVFQLELGEKTGLYHLQGYFHCAKKVRADTLKAAWLECREAGDSLYLEPASTEGKEALKNYCMKKETRIAGPWADHPVYMGQDLPNPLMLYDWQKTILSEVKKAPDNRTLNWVYDPDGNKGKSMFCKFMTYHYKYPTLQFADAKDLANLIIKNYYKKAYFFDLTRTKPAQYSSRDIYSIMESLKNGMVQNTKYETQTLLMGPPHVWIFSNQPPKMGNLTCDRWKVWTITKDRQLEKYVEPESTTKISADAKI